MSARDRTGAVTKHSLFYFSSTTIKSPAARRADWRILKMLIYTANVCIETEKPISTICFLQLPMEACKHIGKKGFSLDQNSGLLVFFLKGLYKAANHVSHWRGAFSNKCKSNVSLERESLEDKTRSRFSRRLRSDLSRSLLKERVR